MGCLIALLILVSPRLALIVLHLGWDYLNPISPFWAVLGWLFLPWTTLWCAYVYNNGGDFSGLNLVLLIVAILFDLAASASGSSSRHRHQE